MSDLTTRIKAAIEHSITEHARVGEHFDYGFNWTIIKKDLTDENGEVLTDESGRVTTVELTVALFMLRLNKLGQEATFSFYLEHQIPPLGEVYENIGRVVMHLGAQVDAQVATQAQQQVAEVPAE